MNKLLNEGIKIRVIQLADINKAPRGTTIFINALLETADQQDMYLRHLFFGKLGHSTILDLEVCAVRVFRNICIRNLFTTGIFSDGLVENGYGFYFFTVPISNSWKTYEVPGQTNKKIEYIDYTVVFPFLSKANLSFVLALKNDAPSFWELIKAPDPVDRL